MVIIKLLELTIEIYYVHQREYVFFMLKSPDRNDLDPYIRQYYVAIVLSIKLYWSKLISILVKIRDVVYFQITNISMASRLSCRSRSLTAVTSHRLASEIRRTLSSVIILYMHLNGIYIY